MSEKSTEVVEQLPSVTELIAAVEHQQDNLPSVWEAAYRDQFSEEGMKAEERYTRLNGLRDHYEHKGRWSNFLIFLMLFMVAFQSWLLYMVGIGAWDFSKYDWLLPALMVQNLAQVIGLAVFVVKSLFADPK